MFEIKDIPKLFLAFFIILPIISLIHESGHVFFARILGAKNIQIVVGTGKTITRKWFFEIRKYYFWYGFCYFDNIDESQRWRNILIYLGGSIFNIIAAFLMVYLVNTEWLEQGIFSYQFVYFSLYYVFFAFFPMKYPDGNFSDGKILLDLLKNNYSLINQKKYRLAWEKEQHLWKLYDNQKQEIKNFETLEEGLKKSVETAKRNRPSRLEIIKEKGLDEVKSFPRNPL
ncbi:hypothetical protein APR41_10420 [Salegentibacter salinarum]|uniref:Peptidase M50 domain-containing protein n=1 Tax=Salegentibacter salinarum TaxID=447422 RepID=A0A2N0TN84_9FLAO|nr:site-2 protease family protein [Salegentibacter salinarum]PKD16192.1 hypothetical protein APR41_10420 [Salegentibacter salinarum]SKB68082.1 Peptidase family M50 [Salegentibacter salinarum]